MDSGRIYIQSRLDPYLKEKIQKTLQDYSNDDKVNSYNKIKCSMASEIIISESCVYFRCVYKKGMAYPKTGQCHSCPLREIDGKWIMANISLKERKKYLSKTSYSQWLCFGIK